MKIIFFGTPYFVLPVLDVLQKKYDVVGVVTTPDTVQGRKKILMPTPVKAHFQTTNPKGLIIDSEQFSSETASNAAGAIEGLQSLRPDLFIVAAYGHLVPENVLNIPKYGALNIHPSLLPKYRGPSPIQTAILNAEITSGISIIKMDEELDHGPIVAQEEFLFKETDTFESLHVAMFEKAAEMLPRVIDEYINGKIEPGLQDHSKATYCDHITRQDGYFAIENPPDKQKLDRMIRAYYPWPTAWTRIKIKNHEARIMKFLPGERVQLEGGKAMSIKDFVNGYPEARQLLARLFER